MAEVGEFWCFQPAQTPLIRLKWGKGFFLVESGEEQLAGLEEAEEE